MTSTIDIKWPENSVAMVLFLLTTFVICFSFISYFVKERMFLSEPLVATVVGILLGPKVLNWIRPLDWMENIHDLTFEISQAIILVQIITCVVSTPKKFFKHHWKALATLWGPVSIYMWVVTALIFKYILDIGFWEAFILSACCTPTDPVLANSIVSGRFATLHIPINIRYVLSAESAGNDGVAYPLFLLAFLFHTQGDQSVFKNILQWFGEVVCYAVILAVVVGIVVGMLTRYTLQYCLKKKLMDKPSFTSFLVCLAIFTGALCDFFCISNYIAVCTVGLVYAWDDFFAAESANSHAQEAIDMLMNWAFFIFFGSSIYWESFNSGYLKLWKLFVLTALIFVFRRLPAVLVFRNWITPIRFFKETIYVGWFGPIGVGAMWYVSLALLKLKIEPHEHIEGPNGEVIKKDNNLFLMYYSTITFIVLFSIILHGITVPMAHMTLTYTTRSFAKKEGANAAWPKNTPIDGNIISKPITTIGSDMIMQKKNEGEITEQKMNGQDEDVLIEMNESTAVGDDNYSEVNDDLHKKLEEKIVINSKDSNSTNRNSIINTQDPNAENKNKIVEETATNVETIIEADETAKDKNKNRLSSSSIHSLTVENGYIE